MPKRDLEAVEVEIEAVNDRGVKFDGEWHNYSKYAKNLPEFRKGQTVTLLLDGDFVMGVEGAPQPSSNGEAKASQSASSGSTVGADRDRLIVREVALKAAVELGAASDPIASSDAVLSVAAKFEAWLLRPQGNAATTAS